MIKKINKLFFSFVILSAFFLNAAFSTDYYIAETEYSINGITKEKYLKNKIKIDSKKIFNSKEQLESYIRDLEKKYINLRIFDSVKIEYLESPADSNDRSAVILKINVTDTKHFIVLPYYKYDSNDGHQLKAKIKDSNFLGLLNELEASLYVGLVQKAESDKVNFKFGGELIYSLPFFIGPVEASWNNNLDFSYTLTNDIPEWKVDTGFKFRLPFESLALQLELRQLFVNDNDFKIYNDQMYFGEIADFGVPIILDSIGSWSDVIYTPGINYTYYWHFGKINLHNDKLLSPELTFYNKLELGRIDWVGNFRKGIKGYVKQISGYNFLINDIVFGFDSEILAFYPWKYAGINLRMYGFSYMNKNLKFGDRLRGIRDDEFFNPVVNKNDIYAASAPSALVVNLDFPIHIVTTDWEKWGLKFLRKFNFEFQISPFIDFALYQNRATNRTFDLRDGYYTAGIEFLVFPERWKSLQIRASAGFDIGRLLLKDVIDTSWRSHASKYELTFEIGLFY